jgi:hypothetical protein
MAARGREEWPVDGAFLIGAAFKGDDKLGEGVHCDCFSTPRHSGCRIHFTTPSLLYVTVPVEKEG